MVALFETFNPLFLIFTSYAFGIVGTLFLQLISADKWFENHHYIGDEWTKRLGVLHLRWLIRHSFMGKFNPNLHYKGKLDKDKLQQLKRDMTFAEHNHLIAFIGLQAFIIFLFIGGIALWQIIAYTLLNIVFNLYLVLLQQYNKRRIDKLWNKVQWPNQG